MAERAAKAKEKKDLKQIFKNLKSEFKKIVWLDRPAWFRRVVVVILTAVVIAVIISLLDIVIKYGVNLLVAL